MDALSLRERVARAECGRADRDSLATLMLLTQSIPYSSRCQAENARNLPAHPGDQAPLAQAEKRSSGFSWRLRVDLFQGAA
jgi:hypothetical protein